LALTTEAIAEFGNALISARAGGLRVRALILGAVQ